jgi:antitoxin (DNA-binding transcriptional repressor) of toxin-antitoxin stability system
MKAVSMLELRSCGRDLVKRLKRGERMELTYRGRKEAMLEHKR